MTCLVGVIDYGCGNIFSVENALKKITNDYVITSNVDELYDVKKIILPGVGSFKIAMDNLNSSGFAEYLRAFSQKGGEILGICLGMQLLLSKGYEDGETAGLDLVKGEVIPFKPSSNYRVPHIGWNDTYFSHERPQFLDGIDSGTAFYFVHSYFCQLSESIPAMHVDYCDHSVVVGFQKDNICGVQFHPEKSQDSGLKILKNFIHNR